MLDFLKKNALWVMVVCVVAVCGIMFFSWNKTEVVDYSSLKEEGSDNVTMHIDNCVNNSSRVMIRGWIYSDKYPKEGTLTVTLSPGDHEYVVPVKTELRRDVSTALKLNQEFERYGFSASIRKIRLPADTTDISVNIIEDGTIKRKHYACQQ
ncbi:hypothetical protein P0E69_06960 [Chimaeribacter arupi]|uniref:hypothetical protein n=1 Tax=Chimaeribacter arupi TaxID=2060066 RepID=UPI002711FE45|nr:hypothetical protein [Chimaeribacter arupi]WKZ93629.1 hypothetical protein P0E69_06960 [Chimaeribacter arupi]